MSTLVLLTVPEASARLHLAPGTLYNWIAGRRITTVRVGRRVLIPETEVERV